MQTINRKIEAFDDLYFEVNLTEYGKTGADVQDIFFSVKEKSSSEDDAIFFKSKLTNGITFTDNNGILTVIVQWNYDEYDNIQAGRDYTAGLFIKFTGDPVADEHVDQLFQLRIEEDYLRH